MGLFSGMSVLSSIEIIYWLFKSLQGVLRLMRKSRQDTDQSALGDDDSAVVSAEAEHDADEKTA